MKKEVKILISLVLYKQNLKESRTYSSLKENIRFLSFPYKILIYNNSANIHLSEDPDLEFSLITESSNKKLAKPYNQTLSYAEKNDYDWILLLDQDSILNEDFFRKLSLSIANVPSDVAAIVPHIISHNQFISPSECHNYTGPFWDVKIAQLPLKGNRYINAINSCSLINVKAISHVGGFSEDFPLDYLDCWYYYQFHINKYKIEIIEATIQHDLSIFSLQDMGINRYTDYMKACAKFAQKSQLSFCVFFRLKTLLRCIKMLFKRKTWKFIKPTFNALFYKG